VSSTAPLPLARLELRPRHRRCHLPQHRSGCCAAQAGQAISGGSGADLAVPRGLGSAAVRRVSNAARQYADACVRQLRPTRRGRVAAAGSPAQWWQPGRASTSPTSASMWWPALSWPYIAVLGRDDGRPDIATQYPSL